MQILLALGLVLYPSTELRFAGLPIGPGELFLFCWMGLALTGLMLGNRVGPNTAFHHIVGFWTITGLALCLGMIVGLLVEPYQYFSGIAHDSGAYLLMFTLGVLMTLVLANDTRRIMVVRLVVVFGAISAALQILSSAGLFTIPGTEVWYFDRLRGWSLDPNQLAFLAIVLSLLSLHLAEHAARPLELLLALSCFSVAITVGFLTKSDTFRLACLVAAIPFVILKGITWIADAERAPTLKGSAVVLALAVVPVALVGSVPLAPGAETKVAEGLTEVYDDDGQGDTRLHLWQEALTIGVESKLIGFGPGPHLTSKTYKRSPPAKFESHNTPLEIFTQAGLVGSLAFVGLCAMTLLASIRARLPGLSGLILALSLFSLFHFVLRHPIFWFGITICLLEAWRPTRDASKQPVQLAARTQSELCP